VVNGAEWEDIIVFLSEKEAIEKSKISHNARVEIFIKSTNGYIPTYNYYKNGIYFTNVSEDSGNSCVNVDIMEL
jgi:hypothetical protein